VKPVIALFWIALLNLLSFTPAAAADQHRGYAGGHREALGDQYRADDPVERIDSERRHHRYDSTVRRWNAIAVDASGLDHTPVAAGEVRVFGEQLGPARSSRAMAIVHIAMFDAVNAIVRRYQSYASNRVATPGTSMDAAVAQAAHDTLAALFPSQKPHFDARLNEDLRHISSPRSKALGIELGQRTAAAILARRHNDGSSHAEPRLGVNFFPDTGPGKWRQDPVSRVPIAMGARWKEVAPFVMPSAERFRVPPPPALGSAAYATAFNETKTVGGDGTVTPTVRSQEQAEIGIFWAYDGTPSLCAPPRLYNQVAVQIATQMDTDDVELVRLLAMVNTAMADAGIAIWESKFHYQVWRPVTGIREADAGTGPSGAGDGNAATIGDVNFIPLGAPASNLTGPNFTPPFPAYPSGHAGFGAALFQTLRRFYGRDDIHFTFVSDEFNGITRDNRGNVRPLKPRTFSSLSQAEEENGQSRMYLGIHWSFDKTAGITQGRQIANYVFRHAFQRVRH
jgi:hypothetical protein